MRGIIYHELFILAKKSKNYLVVIMIALLACMVFPLMLAQNYTAPALNVYIDGNSAKEIASHIEKSSKRITITPDERKSILKIHVSDNGSQISADIYNQGDSNEKSIEAKNIVMEALTKYKDILVKEKVKRMNLQEGILEPIVIKYIDANKTKKQEVLSNMIIPLFLLLLMPFAVFILFETGLLEERKSKSFYTLVLSNVHPVAKILIFFFFRVFIATFCVFVISLIVISIYLSNFVLAFKICTIMLLNITFIYYILLLLSMVLKSQNIMYCAWMSITGLMGTGWYLNKNIICNIFPVTSGVTLVKSMAYGDSLGTMFCLCVLYYIVLMALLTYVGNKLLRSQIILNAEVI